jgi:hypothetical protein
VFTCTLVVSGLLEYYLFLMLFWVFVRCSCGVCFVHGNSLYQPFGSSALN